MRPCHARRKSARQQFLHSIQSSSHPRPQLARISCMHTARSAACWFSGRAQGPPAYGWARLQCPPHCIRGPVQRHAGEPIGKGSAPPFADTQAPSSRTPAAGGWATHAAPPRLASSCPMTGDLGRGHCGNWRRGSQGQSGAELSSEGMGSTCFAQERAARGVRKGPRFQGWLTDKMTSCSSAATAACFPAKIGPLGVPHARALQSDWRIPAIAQPYFAQVCVQHRIWRVCSRMPSQTLGLPQMTNQKCAPP